MIAARSGCDSSRFSIRPRADRGSPARQKQDAASVCFGRQVRIPDLIKIGREDKLEMSGRKKVPSRGRTIASHLCEHPSLNLRDLTVMSMSLTGPEISWDMFLMHSKTARVVRPSHVIRDGGPVTPENWTCVIASSTHPTGLSREHG